MSTVYFHMLDGDAEVASRERAQAAFICETIGAAMLVPHIDKLGLNARHYRDPGMLRVHYSMGIAKTIKAGGREFNAWEAMLNTALAVGSDALCFLTKMHAQCEIHAWVAGEHREWLAGIIEQCAAERLVRMEYKGHDGKPFSSGWRETIAALRRTDKHPVVMSYSVCERFPRPSLWKDLQEGGEDAFYAMSDAEQWAACTPSIAHVQIAPDNLRGERFGDGTTTLDIIEAL
jgi:hypothetical protein